MWPQWQGNSAQEPPATTAAGAVVSSNASNAPGPNAGQLGHPPQQELSDMLQMLGQPEGNSFEDLSLFHGYQDQ